MTIRTQSRPVPKSRSLQERRSSSYLSGASSRKRTTLQKRHYEGASFSPDNRAWNVATRTSATYENLFASQILANRSRSIIRDSSYAHRAIECMVNNTVGAGIVPQIRCDDLSISQDLNALWREWAETPAIDIEGRQNFYSLQAQVFRSTISDGNAFVRAVQSKNSSSIPFQLQVLELDYLDRYKTYRTETGYISSGIEFKRVSDERFDRTAYWMFREHPGGFLNVQSNQAYAGASIRIPAEEILHIYKVDRPGSVIGVSWFHPVLMDLADLHDYQQAVLRHQKLTNCWAVIIRNQNGDIPEDEREALEEVRPGMVKYLRNGEDVSLVTPPAPATTNTDFVNQRLRGVSSGLGITFECIASDLSGVNFSSGRMGWIEMFRNIDSWRNQMIIPQLCVPTWRSFLNVAQVYGIPTDRVSVKWIPPHREMIQPAEEVEAIKSEMRSGLITPSEAVRSLGKDPEQHFRELARDFKMLKALGLVLECDPSNDLDKGTQKPTQQKPLKLIKEASNAQAT